MKLKRFVILELPHLIYETEFALRVANSKIFIEIISSSY